LGVTLVVYTTFDRHIKNKFLKAIVEAGAIGRLRTNVRNASQRQRALLKSVFNSKIFYAAPTWASRASTYRINR